MLAISEHPDIIVGEVVPDDVTDEVTTVPYWNETYPILLGVLADHSQSTPHDVAGLLDELGVEMPGAPDDTIVDAFMDSFVLV